MADMAVLASWQSWQSWSTIQDGQLDLLKGRMPPNCRRERVFFSSEKGEGCQVCQLANSAITGVGGNVGEGFISKMATKKGSW